MKTSLLLCLVLTKLSITAGLVITPTTQQEYSSMTATITCYFPTSQCSDEGPLWTGPALTTVMNETRLSITTDTTEDVARLKILTLRKEDEGVYYCSCGLNISFPSTLLVLNFPSIDDVKRNQTFFRGSTAVIKCADPGDTLLLLRWKEEVYFADPYGCYVIENIKDSDEGQYTCVFRSEVTQLDLWAVNITVRVTEPESNGITFLLNSTAEVVFGNPLQLCCLTRPATITSWIINKEIMQTNYLMVKYEEVIGGLYTCIVLIFTHIQFSVLVTVTNAPPRLLEPIVVAVSVEGDSVYLLVNFWIPIDENDISLFWENTASSDVNFGNRFNYTIRQTRLRMEITQSEIHDRGHYKINISNQYGFDVLTVKIEVYALLRTHLQVKFTNTSCTLIKNNKDDVLEQIHSELNCLTCGSIKLAPDYSINCSSNGTTAVISVTLLSQDQLPLTVYEIKVDLNGTKVIGTIWKSDYEPSGGSSKQNTSIAAAILVLLTSIMLIATILIVAGVKKKFITARHEPLYNEIELPAHQNDAESHETFQQSLPHADSINMNKESVTKRRVPLPTTPENSDADYCGEYQALSIMNVSPPTEVTPLITEVTPLIAEESTTTSSIIECGEENVKAGYQTRLPVRDRYNLTKNKASLASVTSIRLDAASANVNDTSSDKEYYNIPPTSTSEGFKSSLDDADFLSTSSQHHESDTDQEEAMCMTYERVCYSKTLEGYIAALGRYDIVVHGDHHSSGLNTT